MPRRLKIDDWIVELDARYPHSDREMAEWFSRTGPPRKVPLLCDENIEDELLTNLRENRRFKVTQLPKGTPDHHVWQHAWRKQLVLLTADEDFWDDRQYPLQRCPGVLVLHGRTADQKLMALVTILNAWDLPQTYRRRPDALAGTKTRASGGRAFTKLLALDGSVVEWEHQL